MKDLGAQMEHIELLADQAAKRAMTMSTLPDQREAVPWKRREVIPMAQIMEEGTDVPSLVLDREQR